MTRRRLMLAAVALTGAGASRAQDNMNFRCEDLKDAGLVLVPASSPDYPALLTDIQNRIDNPSPEVAAIPRQIRSFIIGTISPEKRSTSAIFLNHSQKSIAAMQLAWRYEDSGGRTWTRSWPNVFGRALLLPFSAQASFMKMRAYWNTILPGSKRYLGENEMAGMNTDVRKPDLDEVWQGGGGFGRAGGLDRAAAVKSVTLTLDGVFFTDGEFVGPNQFGLWESITSEASVRMDVARTVRDGLARGIPATDILDELTDPKLLPRPDSAPDKLAEAIRMTQQTVTREIQARRQAIGDEGTVNALAAQADTQLPDFRRR